MDPLSSIIIDTYLIIDIYLYLSHNSQIIRLRIIFLRVLQDRARATTERRYNNEDPLRLKLAINIRNWGDRATRDFLRTCAEAADRSTLDAIWFNDHIGLPPKIANNEYGIPDDMGTILDPLAFAAYLAAVTDRIVFGSAVLILPYRPAILTNKWIATIQELSGNRFILGVGSGYLEEEFRALDVSRNQRGRITDETLAFLRGSASGPLIECNGQPIVLKPVLHLPPVYVGGKPEIAIPRAIRFGNGWMPVGMLPEALAPHVAAYRQQAADQGLPPPEIIAMKTLPLDDFDQAIELAQHYASIGVTQLVHTQGYDSTAQYGEVIYAIDNALRSQLRT